ncbi:hypothetical protein A2U01_0059560, partial [Trifolium medium]|nr:hypothetical protein [Trifolium medium]
LQNSSKRCFLCSSSTTIFTLVAVIVRLAWVRSISFFLSPERACDMTRDPKL